MSAAVRVIVCRVGRRPVIETMHSTAPDGHLESMLAIVGGLVTVVSLTNELDLWRNDEGLITGPPLNRRILAVAPEIPVGFEVISIGEDLAAPGRPVSGASTVTSSSLGTTDVGHGLVDRRRRAALRDVVRG